MEPICDEGVWKMYLHDPTKDLVRLKDSVLFYTYRATKLVLLWNMMKGEMQ